MCDVGEGRETPDDTNSIPIRHPQPLRVLRRDAAALRQYLVTCHPTPVQREGVRRNPTSTAQIANRVVGGELKHEEHITIQRCLGEVRLRPAEGGYNRGGIRVLCADRIVTLYQVILIGNKLLSCGGRPPSSESGWSRTKTISKMIYSETRRLRVDFRVPREPQHVGEQKQKHTCRNYCQTQTKIFHVIQHVYHCQINFDVS